ncbi:MAG TPA: hypothetical protein PLD27_00295 [bacterium]|nr:hypothetical protein [bacterium]HOL47377.1 hypothetical protein [bacterium]HPQ18124.1 hypothetical protein [bacterium]
MSQDTNNYLENFEEMRAAVLRKLYETHKEKIEEKKKKRAVELQQKVLRATAAKKVGEKKGETQQIIKETVVQTSTTSYAASGKLTIKKELKIIISTRLPTTKRSFYHILNLHSIYKKIEIEELAKVLQVLKSDNIDLIVLEDNNDPEFDTKEWVMAIRGFELEKKLKASPILILKKEDKGLYDSFFIKDKSIISLNLLKENFEEDFKKKIPPIFNKNKHYYFISKSILVEWEDEIVTYYFLDNINMDEAIEFNKYIENPSVISRMKECFSININLYYCAKAPAMTIGSLISMHKNYDTVVFYLIMKDTPVNEALSKFNDININIL